MDKDSRGIIYALLGLAAMCVIAITTLDTMDRTNSEVLTIFGTTLATIVGAVAGVVVGQRQAYKIETPTSPKAEVEPVFNPAEVETRTGPDVGARLDTDGADQPRRGDR